MGITQHEFVVSQRGIEAETLEAWGATADGDRLRIPYAGTDSVKVRKPPNEDGKKQFVWEPLMASGTQPLYTPPGGIIAGLPVLLCEGETDTWRTWQEVVSKAGRKVNVVGLPGLNSWRDDHAALFEEAPSVYVCLDSDTGYEKSSVADAAFDKVRASVGRRATRVRLPSGPNDLVEFWDDYPVEAFDLLVANSRKYTGRFKTMDFSEPAPAFDWLWEGYLAVPDLAFLVGAPGIGKSWLSMALATAICDGHEDLLGSKISGAGTVVYVDQENPEDVIRNRFEQLGLTDEGQRNLRFLHFQGVRLDEEEAAREFVEYIEYEQPRLVIMDSLSTLHSGNENSAQDVMQVWTRALSHVCRKLNIPVVVLHHLTKVQKGQSPTARGSSAIGAMADATWRVFGEGVDDLCLALDKTRRGSTNAMINFGVLDSVVAGDKLTRLVPHARSRADDIEAHDGTGW